MARLLGIDVGTGSIKALVFDSDSGEVVAVVSKPASTHHPRPEWAEYDPDELWDTICRCVRQLWDDVPADSIVGLAVSSMAEAGVLLDGQDRPVYPIIAWHDPRTKPQADWLKQQIDPFEIFQITGQQVRHIFSVNKLLWLRENEPERFEAGQRWLCVHDYVLWRLTGEFATDRTTAARTLLSDQGAGVWSERVLDVAGLDADLLPPIYPGGRQVGQVTRRAASETGLPARTPVSTGGHDHLCGTFAMGMITPGQVLDSTGTAQTVVTITPEWDPSRELFDCGLTHYHHVIDEQYNVQGGLSMAGGVLRWLAKLLSGNAETPDYDRLMSAAEAAPAGANGVTCLPYLLGKSAPETDPSARGAFVGLTSNTSAGDLVRAVLEGLAYHLRELVEALQEMVGPLEDKITAIGGTTQGGFLPQIKADVTGCRVCVPNIPEEAALGAALLAGLGTGVFDEPADAVVAVPDTGTLYEPDLEAKELYDEGYRYYREVYRRLPDRTGKSSTP